MAEETTKRYRNHTSGHIGVVKLDHRGDPKGIAVAPGDSVLLTPKEEELTAESHRDPKDNPFLPQTTRLEKGENAEGQMEYEDVEGPPFLVPVTEPRPTPSNMTADADAGEGMTGEPPAPEGDAPEGSFAEGEEVAQQ